MKFRPCIDLHAGQVKQIVGSTLSDSNQDATTENFATDKPSEEFARMYQRDRLTGGHVIMLGPGNTEAAKKALQAYPQGLQVGGGINVDNAQEWLDAGASHIIVTSYVFHHGKVEWDRLDALVNLVGKDRLVLDLSCRSKEGVYYVVTDRWQTFTDVPVDAETLQKLGNYCNEFLVHGVDNEGKQCGILPDLVELLGAHSPIPVTYAGGVRHLDDLALVEQLGNGKVDVTIGSALDCFGGKLSYDKVVEWHHAQKGNEA